MRTIFSMQELLFLKGTLHVGCYVILKIVIKDTFISNFVWLEVEKKKRRGAGKPVYVWALKLNIPSHLTGNSPVIFRLKIGRIYLVT